MQKRRFWDNVLRLGPVYTQLNRWSNSQSLSKDIDKPLEHHIHVNIEGTAKPFDVQREDHKNVSCPVSSVGRASDF